MKFTNKRFSAAREYGILSIIREHEGGRNRGQGKNVLCLHSLRIRNSALGGPVPRLRRLEHHGGERDGGPGQNSRGSQATAPTPRQRRPGHAPAGHPRGRGGAPFHGHWRTGPGAGRRHCGGRPDAPGRRPGHRQIHAASAGVRASVRPGKTGALYQRRGIRQAGEAPGPAPGH